MMVKKKPQKTTKKQTTKLPTETPVRYCKQGAGVGLELCGMVFLSIDADAFPFKSVSGGGPRRWGFFWLIERSQHLHSS